MTVSEELSRVVRSRAAARCQYCLMHETLQGATFHVEHVIPRSKGGASDAGNLARACPGCNLHKASRTTAPDPATGEEVPLFHPIRNLWSDHFRLNGLRIEGITPEGRATVGALKLNHERRLAIRAVEEAFGLYPPSR